MRVAAEIPHHTFKITIFTANAKYLLKLEWGPYEQVFKINELDCAEGINTIKNILTDDFLLKCLQNFRLMQNNWNEALTK